MAQTQIINKFGNVVGWAKLKVTTLGRTFEGITKIAYSQPQDQELVRGAGGWAVGKGKGNYNPTASITLLMEEYRALLSSLPAGSTIQDIPDFDITVTYFYKSTQYKDIIRNCSFKGDGVEVNQNDLSISIEFELLPTHIAYNGVEPIL